MTLEQVREVLEHLPGVTVVYSSRMGEYVDFRLLLPEPKPAPDAPPTLGVNVSDSLGVGDKVG